MQWFKSAMVVSSAVFFAALAANGCSGPSNDKGDAGDSGIKGADAKADVKAPPADGGGQDAAGGCPSTDPACEACDVTSYTPSAQGKPIGPKAGKCSPSDIQAFVAACLGATASQNNCGAWQTAQQADGGNPNCLACIYTKNTDANWGVIPYDPQTGKGSLNVPGCLDLALNQVSQENATSTGSCGDLLGASWGCQGAACDTCTVQADQKTCTTDAIGAECKKYADAFQNGTPCQALNDPDAASTAASDLCFAVNSASASDQDFTNFVNYICGQ